MARIQVLELPQTVIGDVVETPFLLVIDEFTGDPEESSEAWARIREQSGARAMLVTAETVDVVR